MIYVTGAMALAIALASSVALYYRSENSEAHRRLDLVVIERDTARESLRITKEIKGQVNQVEGAVKAIGDAVETSNRAVAKELEDRTNAPISLPPGECLPPGTIR